VPQALVDQLKPGGRMVIPIGERWEVQQLLLIDAQGRRHAAAEKRLPVRFVPLVRDDRIAPHHARRET
jgi:protein-L-isoaspartate(D-aspartate) O-methyltransferase